MRLTSSCNVCSYPVLGNVLNELVLLSFLRRVLYILLWMYLNFVPAMIFLFCHLGGFDCSLFLHRTLSFVPNFRFLNSLTIHYWGKGHQACHIITNLFENLSSNKCTFSSSQILVLCLSKALLLANSNYRNTWMG